MTQTILVDSASQAPRSGDPAGQALGGAGERALDCLLAAGFGRTEPPILHPAAIFLDMSGEEVRRRLFLTADAAGEELCLRPEYTIPVCRAYLSSDKAGKIAEYSYLGPVFRARAGQVGEQTQTGLESFGRRDAEAADAEVFSLAMEAATAAGGGALVARLGDAGLFDAMLDSLKIPEPWRRRLRRGVARGRSLEAIFSRPSQSALAQPGRAGGAGERRSRRRQGAGRGSARDRRHRRGRRTQRQRDCRPLSGTGVAQVGSADRSGEAGGAGRLLGISGDPDQAAVELRRLAQSAGLDLGAALDAFERRNGFIAARGVAIEATRFSAAFVRDFDYYTGFVFEAHDPHSPARRPRSPADVTTGSPGASARMRTFPPSAPRSLSTGS